MAEKKEDKVEPLSGTPGKENQCEAVFAFSLVVIPGSPEIAFRCMREKHEDGKHEHYGVSSKGWDYTVTWDEPKGARAHPDMNRAFIGKESQRTM